MKPTALDLRNAILAWGLNNGIVADTVAPPLDAADLSLVPFSDAHAEFFRTRKIVRVSIQPAPQTPNRDTLTIFSRLAIAQTKVKQLVKAFDDVYGDASFSLKIDVSKPFKIDHTVQVYGNFEPIRRHKRRIACGSSVGLGNQRNSGTLTALAVRKKENRFFGLSCNHVLGGCSTARPGTPIVVPGIRDVSKDHDEITVIGDHVTTARMSQGLPDITDISKNRDLACFELRDKKLLSSMQGAKKGAYDTPSRFAEPKIEDNVKKWGRSTGLTTGFVSNINTDAYPVEYNITSYYGPMNSQRFVGTIFFDKVYEIVGDDGPFSLGGDSGALVVTHDGNAERAIGVVIAGDKSLSVALPIEPVLEELDLKLLSKHNV